MFYAAKLRRVFCNQVAKCGILSELFTSEGISGYSLIWKFTGMTDEGEISYRGSEIFFGFVKKNDVTVQICVREIGGRCRDAAHRVSTDKNITESVVETQCIASLQNVYRKNKI